MSNSSSYDMAFRLCQILRKHKSEISEHEGLIIYPSSWYDKYFEIIFRDKDYGNDLLEVDLVKVGHLIGDELESEGWLWVQGDDVVLFNGDGDPKQYNLQFEWIGGE